MDTPVKRYSSGMYVRLAFAVAAHLEPEILLVDEVLAVGDAEFQRRCLGRMEELGSSGRTVIFVSHQLPAVAQLCDRAIQIAGGRIVDDGPAAAVIAKYLHQAHSAGTERVWEPDAAPGDDLARILGVRVLPHDEMPPASSTSVDRSGSRSCSGCCATGSRCSRRSRPWIGEGAIAFNAMDTDARWHRPSAPGDYA